MTSITLQRSPQLTALVTCSINSEQQQAFIDHLEHFLKTAAQSPCNFSIMFFSSAFQQPSSRELEVLQLVAEGWSNREIAQRLYLSPNTVKTHVRSLLNKFGVNRRIQLVAIAMTSDLLNHAPSNLNQASWMSQRH